MTKFEFLEVFGEIDDEIIEKSERENKIFSKKKAAFVLAAILIVAFSITSVASGWFENKMNGIKISERFDRKIGMYEYNIEFNVEIKDDAKEVIKEYYLPKILLDGEYNASATPYYGMFYWENKEKKQIISFNQDSALMFDDIGIFFEEKMKISREKFAFGGGTIDCVVFEPFKKENGRTKNFYWSDGYNVFRILAINVEDEFIAEVIKSLEVVEDFSEYGKFRELKWHGH